MSHIATLFSYFATEEELIRKRTAAVATTPAGSHSSASAQNPRLPPNLRFSMPYPYSRRAADQPREHPLAVPAAHPPYRIGFMEREESVRRTSARRVEGDGLPRRCRARQSGQETTMFNPDFHLDVPTGGDLLAEK